MQVILLEKVHNLGELGELVNVKSGFGRNYLIPYGKAEPATPENIKKFEAHRAELEKLEAEHLAAAQKRAKDLKDTVVIVTCQAQEEGKLFGSVGLREIMDALAAKSIQIEKQEIDLPEGPIYEVGEYDITIRLHGDVTTTIKIKVEAEKES